MIRLTFFALNLWTFFKACLRGPFAVVRWGWRRLLIKVLT